MWEDKVFLKLFVRDTNRLGGLLTGQTTGKAGLKLEKKCPSVEGKG